MTADYRRRLAENVGALLDARGMRPERLQAPYLAGAKKGKLVSARTIAYILADRDDKYGANLDALAAIACSLGVDVYQLLLPDLDPFAPITPQRAESYIEAEVERRLASALSRAITRYRKLHGLEPQGDQHAQDANRNKHYQIPSDDGPTRVARERRRQARQTETVRNGRSKTKTTADS